MVNDIRRVRVRRPLGEQLNVSRYHIAGKVPCIGAVSLLVPATESVTRLTQISRLANLAAVLNNLVGRCCAVAVGIEANGVALDISGESSCVGRVTRNCCHSRRPLVERISVLRISGLGRRCTRINRCSSIAPVARLLLLALNNERNSVLNTVVVDINNCASVSGNSLLAERQCIEARVALGGSGCVLAGLACLGLTVSNNLGVLVVSYVLLPVLNRIMRVSSLPRSRVGGVRRRHCCRNLRIPTVKRITFLDNRRCGKWCFVLHRTGCRSCYRDRTSIQLPRQCVAVTRIVIRNYARTVSVNRYRLRIRRRKAFIIFHRRSNRRTRRTGQVIRICQVPTVTCQGLLVVVNNIRRVRVRRPFGIKCCCSCVNPVSTIYITGIIDKGSGCCHNLVGATCLGIISVGILNVVTYAGRCSRCEWTAMIVYCSSRAICATSISI